MTPSSNGGEPRFPNVEYARRMPLKRASWKLAWWLMRRVTMRGQTPYQQAFMIEQALGYYSSRAIQARTTTSSSSSYTVKGFSQL